ncbi:cation:proton antiporter [Paramesorhizobium deserti]|uniref:Cation:proton antiporter n=1 Tax=Paramesorhizobium deserti TaxID=1494590 RepID=A0A135HZ66_9HYPH|nr:Na+/H+ antiporter subunit E [Paramesorhizobium deserti]KXF78475.1 cation:proton antiporter [Paramesorhizobium deserti]
MTRLLPYPLLALSLFLMWLLLNGVSAGQLLLGAAVAFGATWAMRALDPSKPRIRRWRVAAILFAGVFVDIIKSNFDAARIILLRSGRARPALVHVPLALRDPTGLAVLACILTCMPGTAWIEYNATSRELLMHVLDAEAEEYWGDLVKQRYERPLREIFE